MGNVGWGAERSTGDRTGPRAVQRLAGDGRRDAAVWATEVLAVPPAPGTRGAVVGRACTVGLALGLVRAGAIHAAHRAIQGPATRCTVFLAGRSGCENPGAVGAEDRDGSGRGDEAGSTHKEDEVELHISYNPRGWPVSLYRNEPNRMRLMFTTGGHNRLPYYLGVGLWAICSDVDQVRFVRETGEFPTTVWSLSNGALLRPRMPEEGVGGPQDQVHWESR